MRYYLLSFCLVLLFTGCPDASKPLALPPLEDSGAMLVSHGEYLYCLGGFDENGEVSSKTYVAVIPKTLQEVLTWEETTPLPVGRANGTAFAVGNLLYVVGGYDGTNPTSTIYYTSISSTDGTLGFSGTPRFWEQNPNNLPFALSHASHVVHDGRVFLIGGKTIDALSASIIHARVWQKGFIGMWYSSPQQLSSGRYATGAALWYDSADLSQPYLFIAGGIDSLGSMQQETAAFAIGKSGKLGTAEPTTLLPKALASPLVFSDASHLWVAGGVDDTMQASSTAYRESSPTGMWTAESEQVLAEGPSPGRGNALIWFIKQGSKHISDITCWKPQDLGPSVPIIGPGSGIIQSNTKVTYRGEAGTTVSYCVGDGQWNDISLLGKIAEDQAISFKAVSPATGAASATIKRDYHVRPLGFLVHVSGSIQLQDQEDPFSTIYLTDDLRNAQSTARPYIWAEFPLLEQTEISIRWNDASLAEDSPYTATIKLSLFEEDMLSEALSAPGDAIVGLSAGTNQPVEMTLQPGTYYFMFEDTDGKTGTSFGLSVSRNE